MRGDDEAVEYGTCPVCGYLMLPVLAQSPCGHEQAPLVAPMGEVGSVYSWTRVWLDADAGRLLAMADFLDGRLRVTAPLLDADAVSIDDRVRVVRGTSTPYALRLV